MPKELLAGFFLQYSVMPLSGYFVSKLLNLPSYYAASLILVAALVVCIYASLFIIILVYSAFSEYTSSPVYSFAGTASNIVTYIARGNVALSVLIPFSPKTPVKLYFG
ncbi:hypothetical protein ACFX1R_032690 [Malus domestica]